MFTSKTIATALQTVLAALAALPATSQAATVATVNAALAPVGMVIRRQRHKAAATRRLTNIAAELTGMLAAAEQAERDASAAIAADVVTAAFPGAPVAKEHRADVALTFLQSNPDASAHDTARALGLEGNYAPQAATAALTQLIRRGLATKSVIEGVTVYRAA